MATFHSALEDFRAARQQAALQSIVARLTGQSNELLSYEETVRKLKPQGSVDRGLRDVPINAIVGTMGRYADFTRSFLPRQKGDAQRWANVRVLAGRGAGLPPVDLYQVGSVYFVRDGHHRISVAKQEGATHIAAYVVEVRTLVQLEQDATPADLIIKGEYANFLELTRLNLPHPEAGLQLTELGQYARLLEHIEAYRQHLAREKQQEVTLPEAADHWYDQAYLPLALLIRERGLLRHFPKRTETDLYLWITEHQTELQQELGWQVSTAGVVTDWAVRQTKEAHPEADGEWRKSKLMDRYTETLFPNLLVPLSGSPESWMAVTQALAIARLEQAYVCGLHITSSARQQESAQVAAIQAEFEQRCQEAGVPGNLALESGPVARTICERALLTDLVILPITHPPAEKSLARLGSGLRTVIMQSPQPILAVTGETSAFRHGMLAYDGTPKAQEALFLAMYLAERWGSKITLATALHNRMSPDVQERARAYCEFHEIEANFVLVKGADDASGRALLERVYHEHGCDFILMGAYSASLVKEMRLGSLLDNFLREMRCPIFICR